MDLHKLLFFLNTATYPVIRVFAHLHLFFFFLFLTSQKSAILTEVCRLFIPTVGTSKWMVCTLKLTLYNKTVTHTQIILLFHLKNTVNMHSIERTAPSLVFHTSVICYFHSLHLERRCLTGQKQPMTTSQAGWYRMFHGLGEFMDVTHVCGQLTRTANMDALQTAANWILLQSLAHTLLRHNYQVQYK